MGVDPCTQEGVLHAELERFLMRRIGLIFRWLRVMDWSYVFEFLGFAAVAIAVGHFAGWWWALLPAGVYFFFVGRALDRSKP